MNEISHQNTKMKKILLSLATAVTATFVASAQTVINPANFPGDVTQTGNIINIIDDITLSSGEYILDSTTFVNPGVTLTINPGVVVRGQPAEDPLPPGSLVVSRGGFINANGLQIAPIIFTTAADTNRGRWQLGDTFLDADPINSPLPPVADPGVGDIANVNLWGAVTLLGYAPTNRGTEDTGVAGEAFVEGFGLTSEQVTYGGSLPNDSSGSLSYVSIRHSGRTIVEGDEQQGLTLGGVGAGTLLENIDIYCSGDDGIEIFGGTANLKNVIISYVNDDGFDLDQGWTGNVQFLFILASNIADASGLVTSDECGEWDGQDGVDDTTAAITTAITDFEAAVTALDANPADPTAQANFTAAQLALEALTEQDALTTTGQPFMAPTIYNMTVFAEGAAGSLEIDAAFGGNVYNSILFGINRFDIEDETSANPILEGFPSASPADRLLAGSLNINGVSFVGLSGTTAASISDTSFAEAVMTNNTAVALNSTSNTFSTAANPFFFGLQTGGVFNTQETANGINPVPLTGVGNAVPTVGAFFDSAEFRGAFPPNGTAIIFTTGWSALNVRGILVDAGNGANIL